jgi:REP-associated tyrosine transposase
VSPAILYLVGRMPRINLAGLTYHVWSNGTSGQRLFRDEVDKNMLLKLLADEVKLSKWICLAYVVMTTHYHVLLRLQEPTLSRGFQRFNLRYARYYNKRYGLRGHAFDAPYEYRIVDGPSNELEVARYIALNPIKANMCERPEDYPWSSYGSLIGLFEPDGIVDERNALAPLGGSRPGYQAYVEEPDARVRLDLTRMRSRYAPKQVRRRR